MKGKFGEEAWITTETITFKPTEIIVNSPIRSTLIFTCSAQQFTTLLKLPYSIILGHNWSQCLTNQAYLTITGGNITTQFYTISEYNSKNVFFFYFFRLYLENIYSEKTMQFFSFSSELTQSTKNYDMLIDVWSYNEALDEVKAQAWNKRRDVKLRKYGNTFCSQF